MSRQAGRSGKLDDVSTAEADAVTLADRTDFYEAWNTINAADEYKPIVRARAFAIWVALFGYVNPDGTVTRNTAEVAKEFEIGRATWYQYRKLLVEVGLIEQQRQKNGRERPTLVRVLPPLR